MKHISLLVLSIALLFCSCRKDDVVDEGTTQTPIDLTDRYVIDVSGVIVDHNNIPISDVTVGVNSKTILTDENGIFKFKEIEGSEEGLYFRATKTNYFHGGSHVFPNSLSPLSIKIAMIPFEDDQIFESQNGISYVSGKGHKVEIPPNAISLNGNVYTGDVIFNSIWLDPSDPKTFETMPGALLAINDNQLSVLNSFGMIAVELLTPSGEELQITEGSKAKLDFPIPTQMNSEAPSEIDLWHFDELEGVWLKEGTAIIENGFYTAEVSHFSWWNCDIPSTFVQLCLQFLTQGNNDPIPNVSFSLKSGIFGISTAISDLDGKYCNLVPDNEILELKIFSSCNEVISTQDIGPFNIPNSTMNIVMETSPEFYNVNITGILLDCNNDPVSNGYVYTKSTFNHQIAYTDNSGSYNLDFFISCEDELIIEGYDLNLLTQTSQTLSLDGSTQYNLSFNTCGNTIDSYLRYEENGIQFLIEGCEAKKTPVETLILASDNVSSIEGILGFKGFDVGPYDGLSSGIFQENTATFDIELYGEIGELVSGSFTVGNITGNFVAERTR